MFQLYYDTRGEALAENLARLLVQTAADDPLTPRTVLVPQLGLERWLTRVLAERHGIAANLEFIAPAKFARRLLKAWQPELAERSPFDRELLAWRLYTWLPEVAQRDADLQRMLPAEATPLRRLQLAGRFAHLFERYQAYRPDVLARWADGKLGPQEQGLQGQQLLWQHLVAAIDEPPRSRLMRQYIARFGAEAAPPPPGLRTTLFAYGCINISPQVLDLLRVLARHAELHFMMPTPCGEYWGELPNRREVEKYLDDFSHFMGGAEPNRLLVSLGGIGREFVARVFADDALDIQAADAEAMRVPRKSLLGRLQDDLVTLTQPDPRKPPEGEKPLAAPDASIRFQLCHSPLREVQVLHDHLLDLLADEPTLEPRDIVVMAPDVGRYAAAVEAVFGALDPDDPRYLPWTLADRAAVDADPLTATFVRLLSLPVTRISLERVLEVLEVPAALLQARLQALDLGPLERKAREAGIRWGEDAADREREGLPAFDDFSWSFGRRRLLLGYLLGDEGEDQLLQGIAPLSDIEGELAHGFAALARLARQLHQLKRAMQAPRDPRAWQALFNRHLGQMLDPDPDDRAGQRALADVRQALAGLADDAEEAGFDGELDWSCVRELVGARLCAPRPGQRYMDGGVSVCSMVPMRDVPFQVVCLLGLDAESFPKHDDADVLSLIRRDAEGGGRVLGDRSQRDDDRYLFLQTLMAARRCLYLSYTAVDVKNGRPREPSVLLTELLEHLCRGYFLDAEAARKALLTPQPMQPFSPRLFAGDAGVFTYRHEWRDAAERGAGPAREARFADIELPPSESQELDLAELKRFFAAPQRAFLQRQAGLAIRRIDETAGREPLVLGSLETWQLQAELLPELLAGAAGDPAALQARMRARALLPPFDMGETAFEASHAAMAPQVKQWLAWAGVDRDPRQRQPVAIDLGELGSLRGQVDGVCPAGFAGWVGNNGSGSVHKRWFGWWLEALAWRAAIDGGIDGGGQCRAFGINKDKAKPSLPATLAVPDKAVAIERLRELVALMHQGQRRPLPLPPKTGWAMAEKLAAMADKNDVAERAVAAGRKVWADGDWPECEDPWIANALRGADPFDDEDASLELARQIYVPLWRVLLGQVLLGKEDDDA